MCCKATSGGRDQPASRTSVRNVSTVEFSFSARSDTVRTARNTSWDASPVWRAELFRARGHVPGEWLLQEQGGALKARRKRQADNDIGALNWTAGLQRRRLSQQA